MKTSQLTSPTILLLTNYKSLLILLLILITQLASLQAQNTIVFSDSKLNDLLVSKGIDTSQNGLIEDGEAKLLTALYIKRTDNVVTLDNMDAFSNLDSIEIESYSTVTKIDLRNLSKLRVFRTSNNPDYTTFYFEGLPEVDSLIMERQLRGTITIIDAPKLKLLDLFGSYQLSLVKIINAPLLTGYSLPGYTANINLEKVGKPKGGVIVQNSGVLGKFTSGSTVRLIGIDSLKSITIYHRDSMKLSIKDNALLETIELDGNCSFDTLDLSSNVSLESFSWLWDSSRGYEDNKVFGPKLIDISGLSKLTTFIKSCDYNLQKLKYDHLPNLEELTIRSVSHTNLDGNDFPMLKKLEVPSSLESLKLDALDSLESVEYYGGNAPDFMPNSVYIASCPFLSYVQFQYSFTADSISLVNLPLLHTGGSSLTFGFKESNPFNHLDNVSYLRIEDVPFQAEVDLWDYESEKYVFAPKLTTLILKNLKIDNTDIVDRVLTLEKLVITGSTFSSLDLSLLENLREVNLLGNSVLTSTCVVDAESATNDVLFQKDNINTWSDSGCLVTESVEESFLASDNIYFNSRRNTLVFENYRDGSKIIVIDYSGKMASQGVLSNGEFHLNNVPEGFYICKVGNSALKFVKY